ncbi:MAG: tetratricopeptide repeat protein [Synergistales bacterium]|nr:tetratricopeptide repeat protein [Synergistales bacterium]
MREKLGRIDELIRQVREAAWEAHRLQTMPPLERARHYWEEGNGVYRQKRFAEALAFYRKALETAPELPQRYRDFAAKVERRVRAEEHSRRARQLEQSGRHAEALAAYRQALAVYPDLPGDTADRISRLETLMQKVYQTIPEAQQKVVPTTSAPTATAAPTPAAVPTPATAMPTPTTPPSPTPTAQPPAPTPMDATPARMPEPQETPAAVEPQGRRVVYGDLSLVVPEGWLTERSVLGGEATLMVRTAERHAGQPAAALFLTTLAEKSEAYRNFRAGKATQALDDRREGTLSIAGHQADCVAGYRPGSRFYILNALLPPGSAGDGRACYTGFGTADRPAYGPILRGILQSIRAAGQP